MSSAMPHTAGNEAKELKASVILLTTRSLQRPKRKDLRLFPFFRLIGSSPMSDQAPLTAQRQESPSMAVYAAWGRELRRHHRSSEHQPSAPAAGAQSRA